MQRGGLKGTLPFSEGDFEVWAKSAKWGGSSLRRRISPLTAPTGRERRVCDRDASAMGMCASSSTRRTQTRLSRLGHPMTHRRLWMHDRAVIAVIYSHPDHPCRT